MGLILVEYKEARQLLALSTVWGEGLIRIANESKTATIYIANIKSLRLGQYKHMEHTSVCASGATIYIANIKCTKRNLLTKQSIVIT